MRTRILCCVKRVTSWPSDANAKLADKDWFAVPLYLKHAAYSPIRDSASAQKALTNQAVAYGHHHAYPAVEKVLQR